MKKLELHGPLSDPLYLPTEAHDKTLSSGWHETTIKQARGFSNR